MSDTVADDPAKNGHDPVDSIDKETLWAELQAQKERNEALEERVAALESIISTRGADGDADLEDVWMAGVPAGKMIQNQNERSKWNARAISGSDDLAEVKEAAKGIPPLVDAIDPNSGGEINEDLRSKMLPAHRMFVDLNAGNTEHLGTSERRVARVFGRFAERMTEGDSPNEVDASGQKLTLNTKAVTDILHDEDLLEDVAPSGYSKTAGRVMREVQRLTLQLEGAEHDCKDMDHCNHGLFEFRPGKPNSLAVGKEEFRDYLSELSDTDVTSADDGVNGGNTPEDADRTADEAVSNARTNGDYDG